MHLKRGAALPLAMATLAALGLASARPAAAQNLVQNPGFETGAFTDWTITGPAATVDFGVGHTGDYAASFGAVSPDVDVLSQTLATQVGQTYTLTFFAQTPEPGYIPHNGQPNMLSVLFGGVPVAGPIDIPNNRAYEEYNFLVTAQSTSTVLEFDVSNNPQYTQLDDITVTPVPEPSSVAAFAVAGLGVLGLMVTARRKAVCA